LELLEHHRRFVILSKRSASKDLRLPCGPFPARGHKFGIGGFSNLHRKAGKNRGLPETVASPQTLKMQPRILRLRSSMTVPN
jgi:hypothetical protein